jgi:hypothetical protein
MKTTSDRNPNSPSQAPICNNIGRCWIHRFITPWTMPLKSHCVTDQTAHSTPNHAFMTLRIDSCTHTHTHTHIYCTYACMRYTHTCAHACACSYNTTAHIVLNIQARVPCALKRLSEWLLNAGSPTNVWHGTRASWIAHEYCTYVLYCSVLCHSTHGPRTRVTKLEQIMTPYTSVVDQRRGRDTPMPTSEKN